MATKLIEGEWIWQDGKFIPWHDAKIHVLALAVQFGSSVFEGVRCYKTVDGPAIFRLDDHLARLFDSCRVYRMDAGFTKEELTKACTEVVARNKYEACYIRPCVLRGYGSIGMNPVGSPIHTYIPCWPWGAYLGDGSLEEGVDVCISSWQRAEPNTYPATVKSAGHYNNSQLTKMEAVAHGYADAIALSPGGLVSEGSGQNVFLVRKGTLVTPVVDGTMLSGITRDSILMLARDLGIPVSEQPVAREMLYNADEVFFTGTAVEVTPIRSIDRIAIGAGKTGPITKLLQQRFQKAVHGEIPVPDGWLTPVRATAPAIAPR